LVKIKAPAVGRYWGRRLLWFLVQKKQAAVSPAPDKDLATLAKVLGMMGSAHDGEALAAARKASAIVRRRGNTWDEIVKPGGQRAV
jgi:hypothetical protein